MTCGDCFHLVKGGNRRHPCLRRTGTVLRQRMDPACEYFMAIEDGKRRFAPPAEQVKSRDQALCAQEGEE
jgi:hypothetical protein